jgi:hypothetical protein
MLQYSSSLRPLGASLFTLDAEALGQDEFTYDLVICSLGDPYNTPQFWATTASRLTEKGKVIYTTPSKKWAARFRKLEGGINLETANFLLKDGQLVSVQSLILTRPAQIKLAKRASLELLNYETVPLLAIKEGPISRKVTAVLAPTDEILEAYIFQKASRR